MCRESMVEIKARELIFELKALLGGSYASKDAIIKGIKNFNLVKELLTADIKKIMYCLMLLYEYAHEYGEQPKPEVDDSLWQALRPFLYRIQAEDIHGDKDSDSRKQFFSKIAELRSCEFVIYLLAPYIYSLVSDSKTAEIDSSDKGLIEDSVYTAASSCKSEQEKNDFVDELQHLVAHHAQRKTNHPDRKTDNIGKILTEAVLSGLTKTLGPNTPVKKENIGFDDVAIVQQSFWNRQKAIKCRTHRTHNTIRINGMPFAEGALIYLMGYYADEYAISLEIVDVPWKDVGTALLTNRIDVAIYNDQIDKQLVRNHRFINSRQFFKTCTAFTYQGYYILGRNDRDIAELFDNDSKTKKQSNRVAVVLNSDSEQIFTSWCNKIRKNDQTPEDRILPVSSPDLAIRSVIDGDCNFCIAGGIHATYVARYFKKIVGQKVGQDVLDDPVEVRFWAVSPKKDQSERMLKDIISLWSEVCDKWTTVKKGNGSDLERLRDDCVTYVNRQHNQAFVTGVTGVTEVGLETTPFEELSGLIDKHNMLERLPFKILEFNF